MYQLSRKHATSLLSKHGILNKIGQVLLPHMNVFLLDNSLKNYWVRNVYTHDAHNKTVVNKSLEKE
jgi:hypothetical protein